MVWLETTEQEAGQGLTRQAVEQGVDLVLAAGGDGTVMACVTGLAASGVPWRSSPPAPATSWRSASTCQATSTTWSMSRSTATAALDVGALDGGADRFVIMSGLGFDAAMLRDANPTMKTRIGPLGLRTQRPAPAAPAPSPFRIRPGRPAAHHPRRPGPADRQPGRLQARSPWCPTPSRRWRAGRGGPWDRTPVDWLRLATQVLLRRQRQPEQQRQAGPPLELFRARRVEVDCDRPQPVERDGDPAGSARRLVVDSSMGAHPVRARLCGGIRAEDNP